MTNEHVIVVVVVVVMVNIDVVVVKCDRGAGVDAFFHAIYTTKQRSLKPFIMLLGPHCSHVTESVASITSYWNIVQVSSFFFFSCSFFFVFFLWLLLHWPSLGGVGLALLSW